MSGSEEVERKGRCTCRELSSCSSSVWQDSVHVEEQREMVCEWFKILVSL